jgi:hypothetical protein
MYIGVHVQCTVFLSVFNETNFLDRFSKNTQISWKSVQWEQCCSTRTDGRTDMTKLIVPFRNYAIAPKNRWRSIELCVKQKGCHVIRKRCGPQTQSKTFCALRSAVSSHIKRHPAGTSFKRSTTVPSLTSLSRPAGTPFKGSTTVPSLTSLSRLTEKGNILWPPLSKYLTFHSMTDFHETWQLSQQDAPTTTLRFPTISKNICFKFLSRCVRILQVARSHTTTHHSR